jgi:hypothetical protein
VSLVPLKLRIQLLVDQVVALGREVDALEAENKRLSQKLEIAESFIPGEDGHAYSRTVAEEVR